MTTMCKRKVEVVPTSLILPPSWMESIDGPLLLGGSIDNFIPTIWSARILVALNKSHVYSQPQAVNTDYQGEIADVGDTVKINSIGDPTIFDYTKNTDMPGPETLTGTAKTLVIDQAKAFNFQVDDVDKAQTKPKVMDTALSRAAYKLNDINDGFIASKMVAGSTVNTIGTDATPIVPTVSAGDLGAYEQLVDLGTKLTENNVPTEGRWVVIPPWFHGLLQKDNRFINNQALTGMNAILLNGQVGRAAGFNVLESNNVPTAAAPGGNSNPNVRYKVIAGHQMATSYAEQINQVKAYEPEKRFADAVKGLHLYGAFVERPEALAVLTVARAAS